ncbi:hypothetical protein HDV57DRAFT_464900 [Trichoderma longibrachiatum]
MSLPGEEKRIIVPLFFLVWSRASHEVVVSDPPGLGKDLGKLGKLGGGTAISGGYDFIGDDRRISLLNGCCFSRGLLFPTLTRQQTVR